MKINNNNNNNIIIIIFIFLLCDYSTSYKNSPYNYYNYNYNSHHTTHNSVKKNDIYNTKSKYIETLKKVVYISITQLLKPISSYGNDAADNVFVSIPLEKREGLYFLNYTVNDNVYRAIVDTGFHQYHHHYYQYQYHDYCIIIIITIIIIIIRLTFYSSSFYL